MSLYAEKMPDDSNRIAILYGPLVLAGNLGDTMPDPVYGTPVLLTDDHRIDRWITRDVRQPLIFHSYGVGKPFDVMLSPFYQQADNYYSVYWDFFSANEWKDRQAAYEAEKKQQQIVEAHTIDIMRLGQMQPERDHELQASEQSYSSDAFGRTGREVRHGGYFSFRLKTDSVAEVGLLCTYLGDDDKRRFDVLVDGVVIADVTLEKGTTGKFYDVVYPIPPNLLKGKSMIEVKFQATHGRTAGRVFGCRTMRVDKMH